MLKGDIWTHRDNPASAEDKKSLQREVTSGTFKPVAFEIKKNPKA